MRLIHFRRLNKYLILKHFFYSSILLLWFQTVVRRGYYLASVTLFLRQKLILFYLVSVFTLTIACFTIRSFRSLIASDSHDRRGRVHCMRAVLVRVVHLVVGWCIYCIRFVQTFCVSLFLKSNN